MKVSDKLLVRTLEVSMNRNVEFVNLGVEFFESTLNNVVEVSINTCLNLFNFIITDRVNQINFNVLRLWILHF